MATEIFAGYPALARHVQTVTLGETAYRFTFTWRVRTQAWYFDVELEDGTALVRGRKLSANWSPLGAVDLGDSAPEGTLYVRGPENYDRADWGRDLRLVFIPDSDITPSETAETILGIKAKAN